MSSLGSVKAFHGSVAAVFCKLCVPKVKNSHVTVSEKTDHLAPMQFVQYGPKALQRCRSRDFAISMPQCSTAS